MTLNPIRPNPTRSAPSGSEQPFDDALNRALSEPPAVVISPAFARTVARLAVAEQPRSRANWLGWGPRLAVGSGALLTLGLFALAPHTAPSVTNLRFDAELILLAELGALLLFAHRLLPRD